MQLEIYQMSLLQFTWTKFFIIPELFDLLKRNFGSVNKISLETVSSQNHTSLQHLLMPKWLILKRNQTSQVSFLIFYVNFIGSQIRNMIRPWSFLKHVSLTKEVDWWQHFQFMTTSSKIGSWPANYMPITWPSQWRHKLSLIHKEYPWYKFQAYTILIKILRRRCALTNIEKKVYVRRFRSFILLIFFDRY